MLALRKPVKVEYEASYPTSGRDVNPNGKFVWLQKLAYRILTRYGKIIYHEPSLKDDYAIYKLDPQSIIKEIYKHSWIAEEIWGRRCEYLVVGYDVQRAIALDPMYGQFVLPNFKMGYGYQTQEIMGLKVILVPYIDGFFALPKL